MHARLKHALSLNTVAALAPSPVIEDKAGWVAVEDGLPKEVFKGADYSPRVLALGEESIDGRPFVGYYCMTMQQWYLAHDNQPVMPGVTHWMPLPALPSAPQDTKKGGSHE